MSVTVAELPRVTGACPEPVSAAVRRRGPRRRDVAGALTARVATVLRGRLPGPAILSPEQLAGDPDGYQTHLVHAEPDGCFSIVVDGLAAWPRRRRSTTTSPGASPRCSRAPSSRRSTRTAAITSRRWRATPIPSARSADSRRPATSTRSRTAAMPPRCRCTCTEPTSPASARASAASTSCPSASQAAPHLAAVIAPRSRQRVVGGSFFRSRTCLAMFSDISLSCQRRSTTIERGDASCVKSTDAVCETRAGVRRPGPVSPSGAEARARPGQARRPPRLERCGRTRRPWAARRVRLPVGWHVRAGVRAQGPGIRRARPWRPRHAGAQG